MQRRTFLRTLGAGAASLFFSRALGAAEADRPNVIVILADDIGYGDVGCYGATKVRTPNIDKLAATGLRFTDGHSGAATCTPTRYSLLTGEYAWRKKGTGILPGDAPLAIPPGSPTLPYLLKDAGYKTGVVGKWHLGLGNGNIEWNGDIAPGPLEIGFDHAFLIPATGDRVPTVYVENHRVVGLDPDDPITVNYRQKVGDEPTGRERPDLLKMKLSRGHDMTIVNGVSRIGYMSGGKSARWVDEDMADTITGKAVSFIRKNRSNPFFLYFATHDIHVPRVPHGRFQGRSQCGVRCDAIEQLDWSVGQIMQTLDRLKLTKNTLLIFTSDNGPVVDDGYADGSVEMLNGHTPSGSLRGGKYSPYEGGTRVPFIARWPKRIQAGVSDALISQVDLVASLAALVGKSLPDNAGADSFNVLPALLGKSEKGRTVLVEQARVLALREDQWKYIEPGANGQPAELYDLENDPDESDNLAAKHPDRVGSMASMLQRIREEGRSRS